MTKANETLTTEEVVTVLRLIRARCGHLLIVSGPGEFAGEQHGWLNEAHHDEYDKLRALDDKMSNAVLG